MDILPTGLDLAGVPYPGTSFRGREVASEHWGSKDFGKLISSYY